MTSPMVRRSATARLLAFAECAASGNMLMLIHCYYPLSLRISPPIHQTSQQKLLDEVLCFSSHIVAFDIAAMGWSSHQLCWCL